MNSTYDQIRVLSLIGSKRMQAKFYSRSVPIVDAFGLCFILRLKIGVLVRTII